MSRNKMTDAPELHVIILLLSLDENKGLLRRPAQLWAGSPGCGG